MKKKNRFILLNLALTGSIAFLGWDITDTWILHRDVLIKQKAEEPVKKKKAEEVEVQKKKKKHKTARYFANIGKKTLFRPERKEWKPPPPPPPEQPKKPEKPPKDEPPPPPPPLPNPILDGILILSDTNRIALMKGSHREVSSTAPAPPSSKTRFRRRGRSSRKRSSYRNIPRPGRVVKDEVKRYRIGDEISEMTIELILAEKVVLKRKNGETVEIFLRSEEKTNTQVAKSKSKPPAKTRAKRPPRRRPPRSSRRSRRGRTKIDSAADLKKILK